MKASSPPLSRLKLALMLLLLIVGALGSFWLLENMRRETEDQRPELKKGEPDYTVDQFSLVRLSATGQARYNISGKKLVHYPDTDSYEIADPVLHTVRANQRPMTMRAQRALVEHRTNRIHMREKVQITRPASATTQPFRLASDYLLFLPDEDVVQTNRPVEINVGNSRLRGIGMYANNATREFRLLQNVRGTLPPAAP